MLLIARTLIILLLICPARYNINTIRYDMIQFIVLSSVLYTIYRLCGGNRPKHTQC